MIAYRLALTAAFCFYSAFASATVIVDTPRVEHADAPTYVDVARPRFSWIVHSDTNGTVQTGYRIVVSRRGDVVWDSGPIDSARSFDIAYGGSALQPGERYEWRADVRTSAGEAATSSRFAGSTWATSALLRHRPGS